MLIRTRVMAFIFLHVRGHHLTLSENYLDRITLVSNSWNNGCIEKDYYPLYQHRTCLGGIFSDLTRFQFFNF